MKDKPVILVADDQPENIELLEAYLVPQGYEIVKASNGEEALEKLSENQIDLILLDVLMPGMDGLEVTRRVRQDNTHRLLPIILVSVLRETEDRVKGIEAGCDDFISYPVDKMELLARVRSLLKIKAYNDLMSNYQKELESEVTRRTEELRQALENLQQDITARKQAEEKLRESEKRYRDLYDFLPIPVYEMDLETNITSANRAIYETFRGTEEDLKKGFKVWQLLSPEEIEKSGKNIERLLRGEKIEGTEYTFMRLDGSVFPAIVISSVICINDKPVGLRGAIIDITEHKQAEEKLRRMNVFLDSIVENIPDMIFLKDARELRFIRFNRAGENLLGLSRDDLLGKNDYDFFPKKQADSFTEKDREVLHGKELVDIPEEPIQTRNKGERTLHTKKVPILNAEGEPEYLLGISEDITEDKRAKEQLQHTLESLRKAFSTIIQVMVSTVEARDPYTAGHQARSADLARAIATEMGLSQDKIDGLRMAGAVHDIGKLSIPAEILSKPTKLTVIEFSLIKEHSQRGYDILKDVESPWPLAQIVYQHHERMNGSGYPRNLKGDNILMEARILAVADVVEAMASNRPYRPALGLDAALEEIEKNRGTLYDNAVAVACLRLFREKGYRLG